jgi:predicted nucleic acid-binding protein
LRWVNAGEAACLAVAARRNGRFLTDDRGAHKLAAQLKIPVSGTVGILLRPVQIDALSLAEANRILNEMILKGYRSAIKRLDDL